MYEFRSFSPARIIICCLYLNLDNRKSTAALSVRSVGQRRSLVFNLILTSASMFSRCKWWEEVSQASRRQRSGSSCIRDMVRYCERKHQALFCPGSIPESARCSTCECWEEVSHTFWVIIVCTRYSTVVLRVQGILTSMYTIPVFIMPPYFSRRSVDL